MNACVIVGSVCPTFSVPGISRSGTILKNLKTAVVGANEPMPSVSKKFVTKPMPSCAGFGTAAGDRFRRSRQTPTWLCERP